MSVRLKRLLAVVLGSGGVLLACGRRTDSGTDDKAADAGGAHNGADDAHEGGVSGAEQTSGLPLPSHLPKDAKECGAATGTDGCYFDACCEELVTCHNSKACAKTFGCFAGCDDDEDCFIACAASSLADSAEEFGAAVECAALASLSCGGASSPSEGDDDEDAGAENENAGEIAADAGPLGTALDPLGYDLLIADDPLTAQFVLDTSRAVSEEVTLDGGTLTATAADGTVFKLSIPEGAVYGPTVVTLTPLVSFAAPPLGGDGYGVQIEPDGLALMASPTLTITPPQGDTWPVENELPLAVTGKARTVSLALVDPQSEPLRFVLTHFSSYVVLLSEKGADATLSQAEIRRRFGGDEAERLQSAAAERLGKSRVRQLLGAEAEVEDLGFADLLAEFEEKVVKKRVAQAGTSCAAGKLALTTVLGVERQKQLLGFEDSGLNVFIGLLPTVTEVCMREEYELCRDEHIITRVLPLLLGLARQAALLGLASEVGGVSIPPAWLLEAEEYVRKCLQFELQFDSTVTYTEGFPDVTMSETVEARVPIGYEAGLVGVPADALPPGAAASGALIVGTDQPLESSDYSVSTQEACRTIDGKTPADGELLVGFMGYTPGENSPQTPGGSLQVTDVGISLALVPNTSSYTYTQERPEDTGCGEPTTSDGETLSWSTTLGTYLIESTSDPDNGAWISGWEMVNSDIVASKDMTLATTDDNTATSGPVRFVLFHTPK